MLKHRAVLRVLEFVCTFAITLGYNRWARRKLGPLEGRLQVRALTGVGAERGGQS